MAVKLELSWGGLVSLVVVAFCIFLWMFLLGLWAGQTILMPVENAARPGVTSRLHLLAQQPGSGEL
ncbi:MAG TPA: hypothetical protein ENN98_04210 [Desulfurivibrio alkaliphilus]|uniref:Uncharacterized protein n=1 Tax=Desulfurivibrio alkaliphilus TaxID=427923 RepID=A0A7C2TH75_9BACT|nr:hypothetical protein [Desulfurivibrio alkaliphilus]